MLVLMSVNHATNNNRNEGETPSACMGRKTLVFRCAVKMSSLFINTCLNNMNPDVTHWFV